MYICVHVDVLKYFTNESDLTMMFNPKQTLKKKNTNQDLNFGLTFYFLPYIINKIT